MNNWIAVSADFDQASQSVASGTTLPVQASLS